MSRHGVTTYFDKEDPFPPDTWDDHAPPQRERVGWPQEGASRRPRSVTWLDNYPGQASGVPIRDEPDPGHPPAPIGNKEVAPEGADAMSVETVSMRQRTID